MNRLLTSPVFLFSAEALGVPLLIISMVLVEVSVVLAGFLAMASALLLIGHVLATRTIRAERNAEAARKTATS